MKKETVELSLKMKTILSVLAALVLPFTVAVCGVAEIYLGNSAEFQFVLADFWPYSILLALVAFAILSALMFFLRGKAYTVVLYLIVWLSVMAYLQSNFLGFGYSGLLSDGEEGFSIILVLINLFIWFAVGIGCVLSAILVKDRQMLGSLAMIAIITVISVQALNTTISLVTSNEAEKSSYVLTDKNLFEVSDKDNIIIFVLDRFDLYYYDRIVEQDPDFFVPLDGFTLYDNNISLYSRTYPSVTYMLTGVENNFKDTRISYFNEAYGNSSFFNDLKANNYKINLYTADYYAYDSARVFGDMVDNMSHYSLNRVNNRQKLIAKMLSLSLYRYMPLCLKPLVSVSTTDFSDVVSYDFDNEALAASEKYTLNDAATYRKFRDTGLYTQSEKNTFTFLHLNGCHNPYTIDENGNEIEPNNYASATLPATRGCFKMIFEYIEQMKALNVYENATIIITGDHARAVSDRTDVEDARVTTLFVKKSGQFGTSMTTSSTPVCQENLRAEIVQSAGIKTTKDYGLSFSEIPEDSDLVRQYHFQKDCDDGDEIVVYNIVGDAKDFSNWSLTDRIKIGEIYR